MMNVNLCRGNFPVAAPPPSSENNSFMQCEEGLPGETFTRELIYCHGNLTRAASR